MLYSGSTSYRGLFPEPICTRTNLKLKSHTCFRKLEISYWVFSSALAGWRWAFHSWSFDSARVSRIWKYLIEVWKSRLKLVFNFPSPRRFGEIGGQFDLQHFDLTSQLSFTSFIKILLLIRTPPSFLGGWIVSHVSIRESRVRLPSVSTRGIWDLRE